MAQDEWLTVQDIARLLNVHPETVRRWVRSGQLKGRAFGGRTGYRIRRAELDRFLLEEDQESGLGGAAA